MSKNPNQIMVARRGSGLRRLIRPCYLLLGFGQTSGGWVFVPQLEDLKKMQMHVAGSPPERGPRV